MVDGKSLRVECKHGRWSVLTAMIFCRQGRAGNATPPSCLIDIQGIKFREGGVIFYSGVSQW